jgi:hypothetical protein
MKFFMGLTNLQSLLALVLALVVVEGQPMEKVVVSHQTELSSLAHHSTLRLYPESVALDETLMLAFCSLGAIF